MSYKDKFYLFFLSGLGIGLGMITSMFYILEKGV